jgi:co-chaperonin GroES (HSP10)
MDHCNTGGIPNNFGVLDRTMMKPLNRRLLIEVIKEAPREGSFFVPKEEKPQDFVAAKVICCASDCSEDLTDKKVIVHAFGVEKIIFEGQDYTFIGESNLVCVI